jgi:hypothetical protein
VTPGAARPGQGGGRGWDTTLLRNANVCRDKPNFCVSCPVLLPVCSSTRPTFLLRSFRSSSVTPGCDLISFPIHPSSLFTANRWRVVLLLRTSVLKRGSLSQEYTHTLGARCLVSGQKRLCQLRLSVRSTAQFLLDRAVRSTEKRVQRQDSADTCISSPGEIFRLYFPHTFEGSPRMASPIGHDSSIPRPSVHELSCIHILRAPLTNSRKEI